MNRNQKIFLIFGITSLTVFLISWYTFYPSLFTKTTGYRYTSLYETDTVTVHTPPDPSPRIVMLDVVVLAV